MSATHYRLAEDARRWRKMKVAGHDRRVRPARTLCGKVVALADARAFRVNVLVTCPECLVLRDAVLEEGSRKPLTVRRVRALRERLKPAAQTSLNLTLLP